VVDAVIVDEQPVPQRRPRAPSGGEAAILACALVAWLLGEE